MTAGVLRSQERKSEVGEASAAILDTTRADARRSRSFARPRSLGLLWFRNAGGYPSALLCSNARIDQVDDEWQSNDKQEDYGREHTFIVTPSSHNEGLTERALFLKFDE